MLSCVSDLFKIVGPTIIDDNVGSNWLPTTVGLGQGGRMIFNLLYIDPIHNVNHLYLE